MKIEHSTNHKLNKTRKTKHKKNKSLYYIFAIIGLFAVIALFFSGLSLIKFFLIFALEMIGTVIISWAILAYFNRDDHKGRHVSVPSKTSGAAVKALTSEPDLHMSMDSKQMPKKLRKLEKANFNWSDEDILRRKQNSPMKQVEVKEEKKILHYRSPFDPINPPAKTVQKEADIQEDVGEHPIVIDDSDLSTMNDQEKIENTDYLYQDERSICENDSYKENSEENDVNIDESEYLYDSMEQHDHRKVETMSHEDSERTAVQYAEKADRQYIYANRKVRAVAVKKKPLQTDSHHSDKTNDHLYPSVNLLNKNNMMLDRTDMEYNAQINAKKLVEALASFGVGVKLLNISQGPSVTRYELQPNTGVKVSKIVNLSDDIALNLAAKDVRMEAPIPGKAAIGIEVPNKQTIPVFLREVIESREFQDHPSKVAFAIGKDIAGHHMVADIARMPHLLIAGATGSGKSVCINTLIASILFKASPAEVRLLLIDPKVVELGVYNGIPHLLIPVVTEPKKASGALNWAVQEMNRRYQLFADNNVRDLKGYNALLKKRGETEILPQIVIIIDELADLMMAAPSEVEDSICRLAQMARAAGMHLVIATQRPSVDVITGLIKANIPSRISFAVSSQVDSRTILDMGGAEKLLGKGDMLFNPMGESKPIRVQGAFISDSEVEAVVSFVQSNSSVSYDEDIIENIDGQNEAVHADTIDEDELLPQAIEIAIDLGQASASLFQRKFKIGYSRAARLLDQMEARGLVSGYEGSKPRQVLVSRSEWEDSEQLLE
ncbi:DNA translocase FtsK [Petroclostridium sp. X23]|uniref:DNA translocase FtsK n=1 Tax=Petroclostridium sp. X23 TaxID=3045146 RepID=UPI0024AD7F23|nr:DNA translocase FtsK [Petroclostridium sp. X23]WHH60295.1 DNA translocase FtsK [Petroclostridium sp. X23]